MVSFSLKYFGQLSLGLALLLSLSLIPSESEASDSIGVAIPYSISNLDPLLSKDPVVRMVLNNIGQGLSSPSTKTLGSLSLASSVDIRSDQKTWDFRLRPGLKFTNGETILPESVRKSVKTLQDRLSSESTNKQTNLRRLLKNVKDVEVLRPKRKFYREQDEAIIRFSLREPDPKFLESIGLIPIFSSEMAQVFAESLFKNTHPTLIGPYYISKNKTREGLELRASDHFYKIGIPRSKRLEFRVFPDAESALRALRIGGVDIIAIPTPSQLESIQSDDTLIAEESPLLKLEASVGSWALLKPYWSKEGDSEDELITTQIIRRKSLEIGVEATERFDLSTTYLP